MSVRVPLALTWHIYHIVVDFLALVVSTFILNQSKGHWLLSDALSFVISMGLKFSDEIVSTTFNNLMKEDGNVVYELSCLASNIYIKLWGFWILFFPSYKNMKEKRPIICFFNVKP
jgi:hypothetical protein